jgi:hypothetical protein
MIFPSTTVVILTLNNKYKVARRPMPLILPADLVDTALARRDLRV